MGPVEVDYPDFGCPFTYTLIGGSRRDVSMHFITLAKVLLLSLDVLSDVKSWVGDYTNTVGIC